MNVNKWHKCALVAAVALALPAFVGNVTVRPKATDEALINPDMGFVYYKYSNRLWAYGINTPENNTLAVSVGSWQGTPEIALPLDGQIGATRRYEIGRVCVR